MSQALAQRLQKAIQKIQKQHPDAILQLNEGASEADFSALEAAVWLQLPDDIKEVYRVCNGQSEDSAFLFAGQEWLSLARIGEEWSVWKGLYDSGDFPNEEEGQSAPDDAAVRSLWWSPKWLPFTHDGAGNHLCWDFDPSDEGNAGQVIHYYHDDALIELKAASFTEWLEEYVEAVEESDFVFAPDHNAIIDAEILFAEEEERSLSPEELALQQKWQQTQTEMEQSLQAVFDDAGEMDMKQVLNLMKKVQGVDAGASNAQWDEVQQAFAQLEQDLRESEGLEPEGDADTEQSSEAANKPQPQAQNKPE